MARSRQSWIWIGVGAATGGAAAWWFAGRDDRKNAAYQSCLRDRGVEEGFTDDAGADAIRQCAAQHDPPLLTSTDLVPMPAQVLGGLAVGGLAGWIAHRVTR